MKKIILTVFALLLISSQIIAQNSRYINPTDQSNDLFKKFFETGDTRIFDTNVYINKNDPRLKLLTSLLTLNYVSPNRLRNIDLIGNKKIVITPSNQNNSIIFDVNMGINDLNDVILTNPTNNQVLTYQNGNWINATSTGGGGGGTTYSCIPPLTCDNDQNLLGLNVSPSSDWNGTFDGQQGTYYLDFTNLTNKPPIDTNIFTSGVPDCNSTSFVYGFNSNGTTDCRTDQTGSSDVNGEDIAPNFVKVATDLNVLRDANILQLLNVYGNIKGFSNAAISGSLTANSGTFGSGNDAVEIATSTRSIVFGTGGDSFINFGGVNLTIGGTSGIRKLILDVPIIIPNTAGAVLGLNILPFGNITSKGTVFAHDSNVVDSNATRFCFQDGNCATNWNFTGGAADVNTNSGFFIGLTSDTVYPDLNFGGFRGYESANYLCDNNYGNSHLCASYEIVDSIRNGDLSGFTSSAWITNGPPGYLANANDCLGYTSSGGTNFGAFWLYDSNGGGSGWLTSCSGKKVLACCR